MASAFITPTDAREIAGQVAALIERAYPSLAQRDSDLVARSITSMTDFAPPGARYRPVATSEMLLPDLWRHERSSMDEVVHQLAEREIATRMDRIERDARRCVTAIRPDFAALDDAMAECTSEIAARRREAEITREEMDECAQSACTVRIVAETLLLVTGTQGSRPSPVSDVVARALEARRASEEVLELEKSIRESVGHELDRLAALDARLRVVREEIIPEARYDRKAFLSTQRRYGMPAGLLLLAIAASLLLLLHRESPALMWLLAAGGGALAFVPAGDGTVFTELWSRTVRRIECAAQGRGYRVHHLHGAR